MDDTDKFDFSHFDDDYYTSSASSRWDTALCESYREAVDGILDPPAMRGVWSWEQMQDTIPEALYTEGLDTPDPRSGDTK